MNLIFKARQLIAVGLSVVGIWLVASPSAEAAPANVFVLTSPFSGTISLVNGDISEFFEFSSATAKPGVCFSNDNGGSRLNDPNTGLPVPFSEGLAGGSSEPNNTTVQKNQSVKHPSGFNQKRIISAFNPTLNGGTIFIGLDLPGGFTAPDPRSVANPNYVDPDVSAFGGVFLVRGGIIRPFDADGNGEPETIGRTGAGGLLVRCGSVTDVGDVVGCNLAAASGFSDFASDGAEQYQITITFGPTSGGFSPLAPQLRINYVEDAQSFSPVVGQARMEIIISNNFSAALGTFISTSTLGLGNGLPMGVDVEFMITNVNAAVPIECDRFQQTITAVSGSNRDAGNGEDSTGLACYYDLAPVLQLSATCPPTITSLGGNEILTVSVCNPGLVTVTNIAITNRVSGVAGQQVFTIATLGPGQCATNTLSVPVPATLTECFLTNMLTAFGTSTCGTNVAAAPTTLACGVNCSNCITLTVRCTNSPPPGGTLFFTGLVSNCGSLILTNVCITNSVPGLPPLPVTCIASIAPGVSVPFNGSFTVPAAFPDCSITYVLKVLGRDSVNGGIAMASASDTCPILRTPGILVTTFCATPLAVPGGTAMFTGLVCNVGNVTLTNVTLTSLVPPLAPILIGTLTNNQCFAFTIPSTVGFSGIVTNTVTASGTGICSSTQTVSSTSSTICSNPVPCTPLIAVTINCAAPQILPGGVTMFTGMVCNVGNVALTNVTLAVEDPPSPPMLFPGIFLTNECRPFNVAVLVPPSGVAQSTVCAIGTAFSPACPPGLMVTNCASAFCTPCPPPCVRITADCPPTPTPPGGVLVFSGSISNCGSTNLTNVVILVDQPNPNTVVTNFGVLRPGQSTNFVGRFTVPASFPDCTITYVVNVRVQDACSGASTSASATNTCPILRTPGILVTTFCATPLAVPGGTAMFTGLVCNVGNVTLTNVTLTSLVPPLAPVVIGTLTNNQCFPFTISSTVGFSGIVTNTVTASGTGICSPTQTVSSTSSTICSNPVPCTPLIAVTINCAAPQILPGGVTMFTGMVCNVGNVALTNVTLDIQDPPLPPTLFTGIFQPNECRPFNIAVLVPPSGVAQSTVCAIGTAFSPACPPGLMVTNCASAFCTPCPPPCVRLTANCPPTPTPPGGVLVFSGSISNCGSTNLTNVVILVDQPNPNTVVTNFGVLRPGQSTNFVGRFTVPTNFPDCTISYVVNVRVQDACSGASTSASATNTCPILRTPRLAVTDVCVTNLFVTGVSATFTGLVCNVGDVTLTNVTLTQLVPSAANLFVPPITLLPGQCASFSVTVPAPGCSAVTHTVRAAGTDVCQGRTTNSSATGVCPAPAPAALGDFVWNDLNRDGIQQPTEPGVPNVTVQLMNCFGTLLASTTTDSNGRYLFPNLCPGQYNVTFTNLPPGFSFTTNNVGLDDTVDSDADPITGMSQCVTLAPGETNRTVDAGIIINVECVPCLSVTKSCLPSSCVPGQPFSYVVTVRNCGNVQLTNIAVLSIRGTQSNFVNTIGFSLPPNQSTNLTVNTICPNNVLCVIPDSLMICFTPVCPPFIELHITDNTPLQPCGTNACIKVTKKCPDSSSMWGNMMAFSGTVSNCGNVTLTNVIVVDDQPSPNTPVLGPITLFPGQSVRFTANCMMPTNVNCTMTDTLTARGMTPCGDMVSDSATATCPVNNQAKIMVTKNCSVMEEANDDTSILDSLLNDPSTLDNSSTTANNDQVFTVHFSGTVMNMGNVRLVNVTVVDDHPAPNTPVLGPITLDPGQSRTFQGSFTFTRPANDGTTTSSTSAAARTSTSLDVAADKGNDNNGNSTGTSADTSTGTSTGANNDEVQFMDTVTARGTSICGGQVSASATARCCAEQDANTSTGSSTSSAILLTQFRAMEGTSVEMHIVDENDCELDIESSEDLSTWKKLATVMNTGGMVQVNDPARDTTTNCFYRAVRLTVASGPMGFGTLSGRINPNGLETQVYFQLGATTNYSNTTMPQSIGSGNEPVTTTHMMSGLALGQLYHFRWVAVSAAGTRVGPDSLIGVESTQPGPALTLDGINDLVSVPDSASLDITGPITVEAWIFRASSGVSQSIVEKYGCPGAAPRVGGYTLRVNAEGRLVFRTEDDCNNGVGVVGTTVLLASTWYHVAAQWDGAQLKVFVNGALDGAVASTHGPQLGNTPLRIGARGNDVATPFAGMIDEVRLWSVARSLGDLQANLSRLLTGTEPGLAGYWRFDEGTGLVANDSSTNGNNGTLMNGPVWVNSTAPLQGVSAVTLPANNVVTTSATLNGVVNPTGNATSGFFEWGPDASYGNITPMQNAGSGSTPVALSQSIGGLAAGQVYHYRFVALNSAGLGVGADASFNTPMAPAATTLTASGITPFAASLNGLAVPNGFASTVYFEWGLDASYGRTTPVQTVGAGIVNVTVTSQITNLTAATTYHYRLVTTSVWGTAVGSDESFKTDAPSVPGTALRLNGVDQSVVVPDSASVRITGAITVEAWIFRTAMGVQHSMMEKYGCPGTAPSVGGYAFRVNAADKLVFRTENDCNNGAGATGATSLQSNRWYHVAGVWDGAQIRVYVNGVLDGSVNTANNPKAGNTPLRIGVRGNDSATPFAGMLEEVRLWNVARTAAQIGQGKDRPLAGNEAGLAGYWHFDEASGATAKDSTANGNNGTLNNGPVRVPSTAPVTAGP